MNRLKPLTKLVSLCLIATFIAPTTVRADELLPALVTPRVQQAVQKGLDWLAKHQGPDGNFPDSQDGSAYPCAMAGLAGMAFLAHGDTPSRGPYADNIHKIILYAVNSQTPSGLITSGAEFGSRSMYGHGFCLLFLSTAYGMETDPRLRKRIKKTITAGINLTAQAQSVYGGWTYTPGGGDEGSVTVTQMQALRAAQNAGFTVPKGTIEAAVKYLELCRTPEGGICYSYGSGGDPRLAISCGALASMYNAGEYDSRMADACLAYVWKAFEARKSQWGKDSGHDFYSQFYAAQCFYQAGDRYWNEYFPPARDQLLHMQQPDGSWNGDGIGPVYGTSIALIILQLPYKFLPIYQR